MQSGWLISCWCVTVKATDGEHVLNAVTSVDMG